MNKMKPITKFAPANISCIFQIHKGKTPNTTGSTGVGFTLTQGVKVEVSFSKKTEVFFNGEKVHFPTVETVLNVIANQSELVKQSHKSFIINLTSKLPLGSGFGLSGASALATAYALNNLLDLKKTTLQLAKIAHVAEVEDGTGLGDVTNQYFGGFLLKTEPSYRFKVQKLPIYNIPVYCKVFSTLDTKSVVSNTSQMKKINNASKRALQEVQKLLQDSSLSLSKGGTLQQKKLFSQIISISKQFAIESGLLINQHVIKTIQEVESQGGHASMIMLGNAVFADILFKGSTRHYIS